MLMEMSEDLLNYFIPVLIASLAGGLIGIEREYRDKKRRLSARWFLFLSDQPCLPSCLSKWLGPKKETTRIAAAIVTGIGFLGAGVVLKDGASIRGITTAATIWLVAALGMGSGIGEYTLVGSVTMLVLIVLWALPPLERWIDRMHEFIEINITIKTPTTPKTMF